MVPYGCLILLATWAPVPTDRQGTAVPGSRCNQLVQVGTVSFRIKKGHQGQPVCASTSSIFLGILLKFVMVTFFCLDSSGLARHAPQFLIVIVPELSEFCGCKIL